MSDKALSESGSGWRFASDLMDQPLKVLCELGGWKTAKALRTAGFWLQRTV